MVIALLAVFGVCLGSFANAFIWRFHAQELLADPSASAKNEAKSLKGLSGRDLSITKGRSMCLSCHHPLAAKDLIPVVSYISLRGKCRYCRRPFPDTPLAELLTPLLFILSYLYWPQPLSGAGLVGFIGWLVLVVGFVILALYDIRWFELPHRIVLPLIGFAIVILLVEVIGFKAGTDQLLRALYGALIGGGLFLLLYTVSPKQKLADGSTISSWIGGGDITLGTLLGIVVGGPGNATLVVFIASLIGTLVAVPLLITHRAKRTSHLPFGPYLIIAAVIVALWGQRLLDWYLNLLAV